MTTGFPMVISLKRLRSEEMCQGRPPSRPITPLRDTATTKEIMMPSLSSAAPESRQRQLPSSISAPAAA